MNATAAPAPPHDDLVKDVVSTIDQIASNVMSLQTQADLRHYVQAIKPEFLKKVLQLQSQVPDNDPLLRNTFSIFTIFDRVENNQIELAELKRLVSSSQQEQHAPA